MPGRDTGALQGSAGVFGTPFDRALEDERTAYRQVVRWRALYNKRRPYMAASSPYEAAVRRHWPRRLRRRDCLGPAASERLHYRLKDLEHGAIERHGLAAEWLAAVWDRWSRRLPPRSAIGVVHTLHHPGYCAVVDAWPDSWILTGQVIHRAASPAGFRPDLWMI